MLKGFTTMALSTVMTLSTLCFATTNVARTFLQRLLHQQLACRPLY